MFIFRSIFGSKKNDIFEKSREWKESIRKQNLEITKLIRTIQNLEQSKIDVLKKTYDEFPDDIALILPLAKEIIRARKQRQRLISCHEQLDSVLRQIDLRIHSEKLLASFKDTSELLKSINNAMSLSNDPKKLQELKQEMIKMDVINEVQSNAFEEAADAIDIDDNLSNKEILELAMKEDEKYTDYGIQF